MKKKLLAGLFAIVFALSLTACDDDTPKDKTPDPSAPVASQPSDNPSTVEPPASNPEPEVSTPAPEVSNPTTPSTPNNSTDAQNITKEQAKQIALDHAKLTAANIKFFEIELDRNDKDVLLYEIEFSVGTDRYDYEIKALDGTILSAEKNDKNILETNYKKIGEAKAKEIALNHAKLAEADISRYKIEFDVDDGVPSYEIEFVSGGYEYEYDINAADGKIIKSEKEFAD